MAAKKGKQPAVVATKTATEETLPKKVVSTKVAKNTPPKEIYDEKTYIKPQFAEKPQKAAQKTTKKRILGKKPAKKKRAPTKPKFTAKDFEHYFYALDLQDFIQYTKVWNETALKIKVPNQSNYDQWLNYFKTLSPNVIRQLAVSGMDFMPIEGYAALSLWHDIIKSPHRIGKIHQAGLTNQPAKNHKSIIDLARNNDRMGVLMAVRDQLAEKLEKGAGARDMASLAREMGDVLDQIADLEKRSGPKKGTKAAELLHSFDAKNKRPGKNGGGSRNTSFKSRVTIDDMELAT